MTLKALFVRRYQINTGVKIDPEIKPCLDLLFITFVPSKVKVLILYYLSYYLRIYIPSKQGTFEGTFIRTNEGTKVLYLLPSKVHDIKSYLSYYYLKLTYVRTYLRTNE